ncbi:TniQ family protein [Pelosinus propionicus]|uniref:TniQ protein n=1 Tax=Pelosinus propionicus DSM 13327 TaxID=1123291 RepID=A0A1I4M376_9FIRM|nr:TniQ family protein [Pelosinus propionicus]SFL97701.1 TniQ protein [Pelosinus propionicus DSM 13327]
MIAYFPTAYPDELLYSQLARYYTKSGYMAYSFAAEDLFASKTVRPDMDFINTYTPAALQAITRNMPMEAVVEKHTMFPCYGRFLPKERRQKAFQSLVSMMGNYYNLLPIPQSKNGKVRCLRYCPACAANDREQYGEAYWHRIHQLIGIHVCPVHRCYLMDSSVIISGKATPSLKTAEEMIPQSESCAFADNEIEIRVAVYLAEVFQADVDMDSCVTVGDFLHSQMANTQYRSVRGEQRNIALFHADFTEYYRNLSQNWFTELWQTQKVLTNDRVNFYEICLMAIFLGITTDELVHMELPEKTQQQLFDEEVYRLHEQGLKYPAIAKALSAPYATVKAIGERRYGTYHKPTKASLKSGVKPQNWNQIDEDTLSFVKATISQLQGDGTTRPKKVTTFAVEKILHLSSKKISLYLPKCLAEIQRHKESREQYWAREVAWAARQIKDSGITLTWRKVRDLTNMRRRDFEACLPYIPDYADSELAEQIIHLL